MESAAREMNLTDVAQRLEKILAEAAFITTRIEEANDTLRGPRATDSEGYNSAPEPSALVPLLASRLSRLDNILHEQRQGLNRLHEGLREAPPPTPLSGHQNMVPAAKYASR